MGKIPQYIFITIWLLFNLTNLLNPKFFIKICPTILKFFKANPDNPPKDILIYTQAVSLILFIIGLIVLWGILTGRLKG